MTLCSRLFHTGGLRRRALDQVEDVPAGLADCGHLGYDWEVVNDEGHLVLLLRRQVVGVAEQAEARHVRGSVRLELVHQARRWGKHAVDTDQ